jgi:hypothetical protein
LRISPRGARKNEAKHVLGRMSISSVTVAKPRMAILDVPMISELRTLLETIKASRPSTSQIRRCQR